MKIFLFLLNNQKLIFNILLCSYFSLELAFIVIDNEDQNIKKEHFSLLQIYFMIGLVSLLIILSVAINIFTLCYRHPITQNLLIIIISILSNEYRLLFLSQTSIIFYLSVILLIHSYQQLSLINFKLYPKLLLFHLIYIWIREIIAKGENEIKLNMQFPLLLFIMFNIITQVYKQQENSHTQKNMQVLDIHLCQLQNQLQSAYILPQNNEVKNINLQFLQQNNNNYPNACHQNRRHIKQQNQYIDQQKTQQYAQQTKKGVLNDFQQNQVKQQNANQECQLIDYTDFLSNGFFIIDGNKNTIKCNNKLQYFVQFFGSQCNPSMQNSPALLHKSQPLHSKQFIDMILKINLLYKFNNKQMNEQFESYQKNNQKEISYKDNQILTNEINQLKQFSHIILNENKQSLKEITDNTNKRISNPNQINQTPTNHNNQSNTNISNENGGDNEKSQDIEINIEILKQNCDKANQLLIGDKNSSNIQQSKIISNSSLSNSIIQNNSLFLNQTYYQGDYMEEKEDLISIKNTQKNNITYSTSQFHCQKETLLSKNQFINPFIQCHIPDISLFFQTEEQNLTLSGLIDFILLSQPIKIQTNQNKQQYGGKTQRSDNQQSKKNKKQQIHDRKEQNTDNQDGNNSQNKQNNRRNSIFKCQNNSSSSNNNVNAHSNNNLRKYKYAIQNDYLVLSLNRANSKGQKKLVEIKIGCFEMQQIRIQSSKEGENFCTINQLSEGLNLQNIKNTIKDRKQFMNDSSDQNIYCQAQNNENNSNNMSINTNDKKTIKTKSTYKNLEESVENESFAIQDKYAFTIEIQEGNYKLEDQIKKNIDKFKQKILCSISHELRTPLNCIISMLDMLNLSNDIPDIIKNIIVNPALFSSYILLNIINDILDLAEVNRSGKIRMIFQEFSPANLCIECLNFIKLQAGSKGLQLEFNSDKNVPQLIYSDQNKTRQVLLNLLSNALKFTQKGTISIQLSYPKEGIVQIDVKDTGCGIHPSKFKQIFKKFDNPMQESSQSKSQSSFKKSQKSDSNYNGSNKNNSNSHNNKSKNAGLGLSISYLMASCLGKNKKLNVKSELGKGSTFSFSIVNRQNKKKSCILFPKTTYESNTSLMTRRWVENDCSIIQKTIQSIKKFTQEFENSISNDLDITVKCAPNKIPVQDDENQDQNNSVEVKYNKSEKKFEDLKLQKHKDKQIEQPQFILDKMMQNNENLDKDDNNYLDNEELKHYWSEIQAEAIKSDQNIQNTKNKNRQSQGMILQQNLTRTTLQLIHQASSIYNHAFSSKDDDDEDNQSSNNLDRFYTQNYFNSSHFGVDLNTNNNIISKKNFVEENEQQHHQIQRSQSHVQFQFKNIQLPASQKEQELQNIQQQGNNMNQIGLFQYNPQSKARCSRKVSIEYFSNFNKERQSQEPQEIICEKFNHSQFSIKRCSQIYQYQHDTQSINEKEQMYLISDVMNDSYDKKQPNQFETPRIGIKPKQSPLIIIQDYNNQLSQNTNQDIITIYQDYNSNNSHDNDKVNQTTELNKESENIVTAKESQSESINVQQQLQQVLDIKQSIIKYNEEIKCQCSQILIVDDNEFNVYALELRLQLYSFKIDKVYSGYDAIQLIKNKINLNKCCSKYSLVFMDIDMPGKNGYQTTEEIIQLCQVLKTDPPIISACSAYIQEQDKVKAYQSGMSYYITKPINQQAFENVLQLVFCANKN